VTVATPNDTAIKWLLLMAYILLLMFYFQYSMVNIVCMLQIYSVCIE